MDRGQLSQYLIGITVSLIFASAGMVYGWTAPVLVRLLSNDSEIPMTKDEGGFVVAAVELGDVITPIPSGIIADRFGRKPVILSVIPMYIISWTLIILTRSFNFLILARIISGMAMGIIFSVCPIYLGEIAEPDIRGKITSFCMMLWFFGILASYSIGPYVSYNALSFISISLPTILGFALIFIPESPYNLLSRKKYELARKALKKLRSGNDAAIEKETKLIAAAIRETTANKMSYITLFADPCCRLSFLLVILLGFVALFGGVTVIYAYATDIFQRIGGIPLNADQCTILLGLIYCVLSIVVTLTVDLFGRRTLFLVSAGGSGLCHIIIGTYFYLQNRTSVDVSGHGWILLLAISSYCVFNSIGVTSVTPIYQGEIFPSGIKGIASGLCILEQCVLSMTALKLFQVVNSYFGEHISFWFFAFVNIAGFIIIYFYLIETKGKTLSEIQKELKIRLKKTESEIDVRETVPFKSDS